MAGFVSLFSFLVRYNPHAFATVMQRVQLTVQADTNGKGAERPNQNAAQPDPKRQA